MGKTCAFAPDRILGYLAQDHLAVAQQLFDPSVARSLFRISFQVGIELQIGPVQDGVLRGTNVDEGSLHSGKHILHSAEIDVPVDLANRVGRATHVVLDQRSTLQDRDLGSFGPRVHTHEVSAGGSAVSFRSATAHRRLAGGRGQIRFDAPFGAAAATLVVRSRVGVALLI